MVVSLAKMCAGGGVDYMLRNIARGDGAGLDAESLTAYYTASGYPPGIWLGTGLAGLVGGRGIPPGGIVDEAAMRLLFGDGKDPVTGVPLGRGAGSPRRVVGFDLTFSVPKSVSVLWGIASPEIKTVIGRAHHEAVAAALAVVERDVARTRTGAAGATQVPVDGIVAAAFDHFDSRDGDPQLHTHVTVANLVQAADGQWRTLYGARLYRAAVSVSELYDVLLADGIARALDLEWEWRERGPGRNPARELASIPQQLIDEFSTRARAIDTAKDRVIAAFTAKHGRAPTDVEVIRIRQQATLATRAAKQVKPLAEHTAEWRARAGKLLGTDSEAWAATRIRGAARLPRLATAGHVTSGQVEVIAAAVLDAVEAKHATWSEWNVQAEAARQIAAAGTHFVTGQDVVAVRDRIAAAALDRSVLLNPDTAGVAVGFGVRGAERSAHRVFTSLTILAAEQRLLDAVDNRSAPAAQVPSRVAEANPAQQQAVAAIAASGRALDLLVGPAGSGKSTAMRLLRDTWEYTHGSGTVTGLAPSAAAARVLGTETGTSAETCAQWVVQQAGEARRLDRLVALQRKRERRIDAGMPTADLDQAIDAARAEFDRWRMKPGQLIIIDEAGMADTRTLDAIVAQARASDAKVLLVGDPTQLGAVGAGGAFAMLVAARPDVPELDAVHRFRNADGTTNAAEAHASKQLRVGDTQALAYYRERGRIHTPTIGADPIDSAYAAWKLDRQHGMDSLLIAADNATVTALNVKAHDDLVAAGTVKPGGVLLAGGTRAGVGDRIVTRRNDRHLSDGTGPDARQDRRGTPQAGYVTNGATFTVTDSTTAGDLIVQAAGGAPVLLPAAYVARHVALGYAVTVHRAQGATADTAHVIAAPGMTREAFYVAMTRGRYVNDTWIDTRQPETDTDRIDEQQHDTANAATILDNILATSGNPVSAHTTREQLRREAAAMEAERAGTSAFFDKQGNAREAPLYARAPRAQSVSLVIPRQPTNRSFPIRPDHRRSRTSTISTNEVTR